VDQVPTGTLPLEDEEGDSCRPGANELGQMSCRRGQLCFRNWAMGASSCIYLSSGMVIDHNVSCFQEPDYGALYEGRNPGFYVEANPMPTFKVNICAWHRKPQGRRGSLLLGAYISVFWALLW
jgi:hypothetical protein